MFTRASKLVRGSAAERHAISVRAVCARRTNCLDFVHLVRFREFVEVVEHRQNEIQEVLDRNARAQRSKAHHVTEEY